MTDLLNSVKEDILASGVDFERWLFVFISDRYWACVVWASTEGELGLERNVEHA